MFGSIGVFEIVLIAGLALMILGPDKFPEFAKISMRTVRDIRKYMSDAQRDIASELNPLK
ncbi:MAG TPA: preprotein translocase, partial [Candidatus Poseidoniales archaeon]|nr:preprotein translocase [Candidatus Poseidoniales archaeon]